MKYFTFMRRRQLSRVSYASVSGGSGRGGRVAFFRIQRQLVFQSHDSLNSVYLQNYKSDCFLCAKNMHAPQDDANKNRITDPSFFLLIEFKRVLVLSKMLCSSFRLRTCGWQSKPRKDSKRGSQHQSVGVMLLQLSVVFWRVDFGRCLVVLGWMHFLVGQLWWLFFGWACADIRFWYISTLKDSLTKSIMSMFYQHIPPYICSEF